MTSSPRRDLAMAATATVRVADAWHRKRMRVKCVAAVR